LKKEHIPIPSPNSRFQKISCKECNEENIIYSHVSTQVTCKACGNTIAEPTGSVAKIYGKFLGNAE